MLENMLDYLRFALYAVFIVITILLYQAWIQDHPPAIPAATAETQAEARSIPNVPSAAKTVVSSPTQPTTTLPPSEIGKKISVTTDLLAVSIDTKGGDLVTAKLLAYPESLNSKTPFLLLNDDEHTRYVAESGLVSTQGPDTEQSSAIYTSKQEAYALSPDQNTLNVDLVWQNAQGLKVTKTFLFSRGSYEVKVLYTIENNSNQAWQGSTYAQLLRTDVQPESQAGFINLATYFGAAMATPAKPFTKISFKDIQERNISQSVTGGWAAMIQHYFISAWVPANNVTSTYYTRALPNGLYAIGMLENPISVPAGAKANTELKLYVGPAISDLLEKTAPGLKLTIDYGWFWFISDIIFWMMQHIYDVVGNWGWAIVIVTIIIKILFYQLSAKSFRSMSAMKKLQPKIELLKQRFGDDKQKLTQATLELYRQEKVNPMSGCLPVLIQIPVFIALYWVLVESVQLRQAPFILWIHDLSQKDPYYVLPLLMGISMFIQQRLNPAPPDPVQAKVMMFMPVIFTVLFANFPAGLMLYWFVNNTLSFLQQWFVMKKLDKESLQELTR